jgi:hypothetical protein
MPLDVFLPAKNYTNQSASICINLSASFRARPDCVPRGRESVVAGYVAQHKLLVDGVNADDQAVLEFIWNDTSIVLGLEHPLSLGSVRLASADL